MEESSLEAADAAPGRMHTFTESWRTTPTSSMISTASAPQVSRATAADRVGPADLLLAGDFDTELYIHNPSAGDAAAPEESACECGTELMHGVTVLCDDCDRPYHQNCTALQGLALAELETASFSCTACRNARHG